MKLQNIHEVEDFRKVIHQCKDDVFLKRAMCLTSRAP